MFRNFMKVALRNLWRQRGYALINIIGLAVGLSTSILILLYVFYEKSYDRFYEHPESIYRIYAEGKMGNTEFRQPFTSVACTPEYYDRIPEVVNYSRFDLWSKIPVRYGDVTYLENRFGWADSGFFEIFSIPLLSGDPSRVLVRPRSMVISQSTARKYFGDEDPVGKVIRVFTDPVDYTITGVMEDIPGNSHIQCDFVVDYQSSFRAKEAEWTSCNTHAYVQVMEGTTREALQAKMTPITREHVDPELRQMLGISLEDWEEAGNYFRFLPQPLKDIHLNADIQDEMQPASDKKYIYIFSLVALFIVSMACINFMNLSTARSAGRAREVGIRKVAGSGRGLLVRQFLAESFVMVLIAMVVALAATELVLPVFNKITRLDLSLDYFGNWYTIPGLIAFALLVGVLAGSYPAFFLASFRPVSVISGKLTAGAGSGRLRNLLVVVQFGISIFIILCTIVITNQLNFLLNKDLGFDSDQIVILDRFSEVGSNRAETFKQEIAKIPGIVSSASSSMIPGHPADYNGHMIKGRPTDQTFLLYVNYVDHDFPATYGLQILKGRFFDRDLASDSTGIVVNETTVRKFNIEDPLTCIFLKPGQNRDEAIELPVIGVMQDIHIQPLRTEVMPFMLQIRPPDWGWIPYLNIRLETQNYREILGGVEKVWDEFTGGQPFRYFFLDDDFEKNYQQEQRTRTIFLIFSVIAILVACLGLLGLTAFATGRRFREIGIRKALGAGPVSIVRLVTRETLVLTVVAALIAWPVAWYFSRNWLNDFAYRIDLTWVPFVVSLIAVVLISLFTISFQAVRAALQNPADSLRYE